MHRTTSTIAAALVLVVALASSGCTSSKNAVPPASTNRTPATAPPGLPAFYAVPDPLPPAAPGAIIRTERVDAPGLHGTLLRVMYHSRSLRNTDIAVTGLIAVPEKAAPSSGYPVVSWAHGTTGIADTCAPSVAGANGELQALANALLDAGYLVAATDYEGLGTPGRHPYIVGESEARGVLDIVRAARRLPEAHASDRYVVWGHSQGGHAAAFALHIADQWAPELHLLGVVAGAPPSQLELVYQYLRSSPFRAYLLMAAAGLNAAYGDGVAPLDQVLTPEGLAKLTLVDQVCAAELGKDTAAIDTATLTKADPATIPTWKRLLDDNDPGKFKTPAAEPLLIIQGGADEQIPVASTALLQQQLCAIHQTSQRWIYPGRSHAGVIAVSMGDMLTRIAHRFAGQPGADLMSPSGAAGIEVQRCP
jgi:pimeloyl-ACP methyl ester carboxylesterase